MIILIAKKTGAFLQKHNLKLVTAESCTGGGLAYAITEIPGSSHWFERGFVTYSNESKQELLDVSADTLEKYGAVSKETAIEMAQGALHASHANISISITGIAGPEGGSAEKPIGTVWFAWQIETVTHTAQQLFPGDRQQIREQSIVFALEQLLHFLNELKL